jgi:hypothetical protein
LKRGEKQAIALRKALRSRILHFVGTGIFMLDKAKGIDYNNPAMDD